ncbi:MAG TPA: SHOCT domain-containing protein [Acidimicrobiia bacterium]|nr:SHOCT domain-containing protein [Acidimicrobiia bacterium]
MMWQAGGFWVLWMLLFWGGLVALAVAGLRTLTPRSGSRTSTALSILEERLARGDIDVQEFEERRRSLLGGQP